MNRRAFLCALGTAPWLAIAASASGQEGLPRIGFLPANAEGMPFQQGFLQGLGELGYVEGTNLTIEWRRGKQTEFATLASELVQKQVQVLVTVGTPAARAAMEATPTVPIVFLSGAPVSAGLAASIAHPGRNATGVSIISAELYPKRLEYLHRLAPRARRIAYLMNPANPIAAPQLEAVQKAADALKLQIVQFDVRDPDELDAALRAISSSGAKAVLIGGDAQIYSSMARIAQALRRARLPAISPYADQPGEGVLLSYGVNTRETGRKMAGYVDRILKGAKPGDLPVEQPTKFELTINLKTANTLNLAVPQSVLYRADRVIR